VDESTSKTIFELARRHGDGTAMHTNDDLNFAELGLDSLAIVGLIIDLEREFAVTFPAHMLTASVFHSVGTVAEAIAALRDRGSDGVRAQAPGK
jgi:acyl carrier protein